MANRRLIGGGGVGKRKNNSSEALRPSLLYFLRSFSEAVEVGKKWIMDLTH